MNLLFEKNDVRLRPLSIYDAERMAILANNSKISANLRDGFPHPYTLVDAMKFMQMCDENKALKVFGIEYRMEYCGNISLALQSDVYRRSAEIGYFIGEQYWNKNIATNAVNLICEYGFRDLDLVRIHTGVYEYNPASMRVLEKCGFMNDGIFKKAITKNNGIWSEHRYALINPLYNQ